MGFFTTATLNFLTVGHTHEDIDQLFALMVQWILRKHNWQTPAELMEFLEQSMKHYFHNRGEEFFVRRLGGIRDFEGWMEPLKQKLEGSFQTRGGIEAPHSFACKLRRDLTLAEVRKVDPEPAVPAVPVEPQPNDVMICVKAFMRSTCIQQAPVLAVAAAQKATLRPGGPRCFVPLKDPSDVALANLLKLQRLCEHDFKMPRAAAALLDLASGPRLYELPPDRWLTPADARTPPELGSNPFFSHLPETSWHLLVTPAHRPGMQGKRRVPTQAAAPRPRPGQSRPEQQRQRQRQRAAG
jgi:hypothetical protein